MATKLARGAEYTVAVIGEGTRQQKRRPAARPSRVCQDARSNRLEGDRGARRWPPAPVQQPAGRRTRGAPRSAAVQTRRTANCRLGTFWSLFSEPALVFSASVCVDSVACPSSMVHFLHLCPPPCQNSTVADYSRRYHLQDLDVRMFEVVPINPDTKYVLLRMLDMLGRAQSLSKGVVIEGSEFGGPGKYSPSLVLVTCTSPNNFETPGIASDCFGLADTGAAGLALMATSSPNESARGTCAA
ncbi:hypothetical protein PybrP1_000372 [[Pythium] brassicae (nom. inval.)]|nr:hypothetical protein PybrP1_000372 [[Pythium] brassicae (nom. inval.)]